MSNTETLCFHKLQSIMFSGDQMNVAYVDIISERTGLVHAISKGMDVGHLGKIERIITDVDKFYCFVNGSFYTIRGATLTPDFLPTN